MALAALAWSVSLPVGAQTNPNPNQFGGQDRADAASDLIVLGVQQGISSLPPTSGQSFTYEFDPAMGTFSSSPQLGPTSFRSTQTVGNGKFSFRFASSYFQLEDRFDPIVYQVRLPGLDGILDTTDDQFGIAKLGLKAKAKVGLFNLGLNYGIGDRFEVVGNLPIVIVDAEASQLFSTSNPEDPPAEAELSGVGVSVGPPTEAQLDAARDALDAALSPDIGILAIRNESFTDLGFNFNEGTDAGVGRISIGVKGQVYSSQYLDLALSTEFFFPSPNEDEFAGSDSPAILPRAILQAKPNSLLRFHADVGYDHDFDESTLRRFVWNAGASVPYKRVVFDMGFGGSEFESHVKWTPDSALANNGTTRITALGNNKVKDSFVDFLGGIKFMVSDQVIISGAVNVPTDDDGFRAAAVGTAALEFYF